MTGRRVVARLGGALFATILLAGMFGCAGLKLPDIPGFPLPPTGTDPCVDKTPRCADQMSVDCWDRFGDECLYVKAPTPPPEQPPVVVPPPPAPSDEALCGALPADAVVFVGSKSYGQGKDSTVKIRSTAYCAAHGFPDTQSCAVRPEGDPLRDRCERYYARGCPIWQYTLDGGKTANRCLQPDAEFSCDHFGNPEYRDDPQTPEVFEGRPAECGLQRDADGNPAAGFFTVAHGKGQVRACATGADGEPTGCSAWSEVDH